MNKHDKVEVAQRMMREAYSETDQGGYDEWDQTFIECLRDELIPHLSIEGIKILMDTIERNSNMGINRKQSVEELR
ncbi:hypothetical protein GCM10023310_69820 [Paenibacillus vulneris]|uniref:Uncharacterized protein n=1 Tax=Paenibacillus vulneris TaxID=1133364 RepID=A0ABW3UJ86_9BACL